MKLWRSLAVGSALALAACGGSSPPPATGPAHSGTAGAEPAPAPIQYAAEPVPPGAEPAPPTRSEPYYYGPELHQPFMEGCMGECATERMCECMYGKLQWVISAEDALAGKLTEEQMQGISSACTAENPDPGPLPPGC